MKIRLSGLLRKLFLVLLILSPFIAAGSATFYYYHKYQEAKRLVNNPSLATQTEVNALVTKIGKLIELPTDETPTVATVSDIDKLKDQPFFKNSINSDKVLIYIQNKKAILYRPALNKIIEVAPVNTGDSTLPISSTSSTKNINLALYNGTTIPGLATQYETLLKSKFADLTIVNKQQASKNDYEKTLIIDLSGKYSAMVSQLTAELSGEIVNVPVGETKPNADILIILGKDRQ